jgi:hypothetical protein
MNSLQHSGSSPHVDPSTEAGSRPGAADITLRLIASLPAPEGLAERVQAGLQAQPHSGPRRARIVPWPTAVGMRSTMARGAAAAAIVMVVVGGGWRIYSRIQPAPAARVIVMPPRMGPSGGFATGGAMRTPQTLNGPKLKHPAASPVDVAGPEVPAASAPVRHSRTAVTHTPAAKATASQPNQDSAAPRP